ncbi:Probable malonyl-CoA-acyl carrier protein transacylase, mitochondrial [Gryllus bimaculatus]|nr:Probable malonyl-CoA-acyl carrier protein transacylase, mitochondrial [Gryllus bimaculatus]
MSLPISRFYMRYALTQWLYRKTLSKLKTCVYNSRSIYLCSQVRMTGKSEKSAEELLNNSVTSIDKNLDITWNSPAYPKCERSEREKNEKGLQSHEDPKDESVILFPGQGSQYVGMGKSLRNYPEVRHICDTASDFLGYDLLDLCSVGPQEKLNRTEYSQMAVFVLSYAAAELVKAQQPGVMKNCIATAGFSVGEITALVFAGAISFTEALGLVKIRALAMQEACDAAAGGMMTVFYGPDSRLGYACVCAKQWCEERGIENPVCSVANYLFPHCKVIAGNVEALKFIRENASEFKLKRLKTLPVSGAFHTELMRPAVEPFKKALKSIRIQHPKIPVYSNVDGNVYRNPRHIAAQLPKQIYKPVKWEQILHALYSRSEGEMFPLTYECGPGTSLKSCLKMVNAKAGQFCSSIPV